MARTNERPRRPLLVALALACASLFSACAGTGTGVRMAATGRLTGDVRSDGQDVLVVLGEAELLVSVVVPNLGIVYIPIFVDEGTLWAKRFSTDEEIRVSLDGPFPDWVASQFGPGELYELLHSLKPKPPVP